MPSTVSSTDTATFGALLRRYRLAAGLTQEVLAEKAALSVQAISALEQEVRRAPHRDTVRRLSEALRLSAEGRARIELAAGEHRRRGPRQVLSVRGRAGDGAVPFGRVSLPLPTTPLIGREYEVAAIRASLVESGVRLLTLCGPGGVGKTRLALQAAVELAPHYADGVRVAELAALNDSSLVPQAVSRVVGVREVPGSEIQGTLARALRTRRLLLVLDNCEHLLDACAQLVTTILRQCPRIQILATSREALGLAGEACRPVPPLESPELGRLPSLPTLANVAAVRLFVERARAVKPGFALDERHAGAVAEICRQLDGLPLAIELAAACVKALSVHDIAARLGRRFRLLTGGNRAALPRHQTLRALFDWSYDLLDGPQRRAFARLSVFAGGFTLEAAEAVAADGEGETAGDGHTGIEANCGTAEVLLEDDIAGLVARLVEKSLVEAEEQASGTTRYRLLETLRQYGSERLQAGGDAEATQERHASQYLSMLETAAPTSDDPALDWLELDHDNLRAALRWFVHRGDVERALRLGGLLGPFWAARGYLSEGRAQLARVLDLDGGRSTSAAKARALRWHAAFAFHEGHEAQARSLGEESLALWRHLGDRRGLAEVLDGMGVLLRDQEDYQAARGFLEEALSIHQELGDAVGVAVSLDHLGTVAHAVGDFACARRHYEESVRILRASAARSALAWSLHNLAGLALHVGDAALARGALAESVSLRKASGEYPALIRALPLLAGLAALDARPAQAARLVGAAQALREAMGVRLPAMERKALQRALDHARQSLGEGAFVASLAEGRASNMEHVLGDIGTVRISPTGAC